MEITNTKESNPDATSAVKSSGNEDTGVEKVEKYVPLEKVNTANKSAVKDGDPVVGSSAEAVDTAKNIVTRPDTDKATVTLADKLEFIKAITSGNRYTSVVHLFGGNVTVKFRSRSVEETEAILSYMHKAGIDGRFSTKADVSNTSLAALLVAQVAELDGVEYSEMKHPLKYVEDADGIHEPGWLADMDMWKRKPEMLVAAIGDALVEFEAKYWAMVGASRDENFWNPGGSTGK